MPGLINTFIIVLLALKILQSSKTVSNSLENLFMYASGAFLVSVLIRGISLALLRGITFVPPSRVDQFRM